MFDIGWQELFIIAVLGILVVGPKDLPSAVRAVTGWIRKARSLAREFQGGIDDMVREADLDDIRKQVQSAGGMDIAKEIENTIDPTGEVADDFNLTDIKSDFEALTKPRDEEDEASAAEDETPSAAADEVPGEATDASDATDAAAGAKNKAGG